jgi:hypothetical protein
MQTANRGPIPPRDVEEQVTAVLRRVFDLYGGNLPAFFQHISEISSKTPSVLTVKEQDLVQGCLKSYLEHHDDSSKI